MTCEQSDQKERKIRRKQTKNLQESSVYLKGEQAGKLPELDSLKKTEILKNLRSEISLSNRTFCNARNVL